MQMKPLLRSLALATALTVSLFWAGCASSSKPTLTEQRPAPPKLPRLDRELLLTYHGAGGQIKPVRSVSDWQKRRAEIIHGMQEVMGPLPGPAKRVALDTQVHERVDCGEYVRFLITYAAEPGSRVPAYLCVPKSVADGKHQAPAALCLHPTDNHIGHQVVVGLGGKQNRAYAHELALRGYVTLSPSYPLLAKYQPDLNALGYQSGTMKAIWDNLRGLDLLESLPYVDKRRGFAAIGHSLGGHNAVYTAVFDDRIKVIVSSCGLDSYLDYMSGDPKVWAPEKGWCQTRYMLKLAAYQGRLAEIPFDFHEMIGALAPRVCFISAPRGDSNFKWKSVDNIANAAFEVYSLYGRPLNLAVEHPDCPHDFPSETRFLSYEIMDANLR